MDFVVSFKCNKIQLKSMWRRQEEAYTSHKDGGNKHQNDNKKGKAVPLQAWGGPEGSRKLRFPDFMTMVQDGGKVVSLTHWPHLPPGNTPGTHLC
jgi:hypothetical protein